MFWYGKNNSKNLEVNRMLSEDDARIVKAEYLRSIERINEDISRKQKEIAEAKKNIKTYQDKIDVLNKVLED